MINIVIVFIATLCFPWWLSRAVAQPATAEETSSSARIVRLNFVTARDMAAILGEIKGPDGKVVVNDDAKSLLIMDTPARISAMEDVVRQMDVQTVTLTLALKFKRVEATVEEVRGLLSRGVGAISIDPVSNALTVTDVPSNLEKIRRAVEKADAHGQRFILEAKLIHITLDDEHLDGVDWSGIVADPQVFHLDGNYDFLGNRGRVPTLSLGTIEEGDLAPLIEALDTVGMVREFPVVETSVTAGSPVRLTIFFDEPAISLAALYTERVEKERGLESGKPALDIVLAESVDEDGSIRTQIEPQEPGTTPKPATPRPAMLTRNPRSVQVRSLEDGTVVIGGLVASETIATLRKVPLVGDLPLLGFAFRYHNSSVQREEFVVLLTPKPVGPQTTAPAEKLNGK